jgi:5-methylcytosine-specific restriction endonuclease McrA
MGSVPVKIREEVCRRALFRCEYCLIPESYHPFARFHVEHIFGKKHGGRTELSNLALACPECNRKKGTNIGSRKQPEGEFIRLFNPRTDNWSRHFEFNWAIIHPKTDIGEITSKLLGFNDDFRISFREYLMLIGIYP